MFSHGKRFKDTNYFITENGDVYRNGKKLKPTIRRQGYSEICLSFGSRKSKKMFFVHRLVAECYIPNPNNLPEVNHLNFNKSDNRVENLIWSTTNDNMEHSIMYNRNFIGENNPSHKLNDVDIIFIRQNCKPYHKENSPTKLSKKYNVSLRTIYNILKDITWKHIP
jgi:hypothetical protein